MRINQTYIGQKMVSVRAGVAGKRKTRKAKQKEICRLNCRDGDSRRTAYTAGATNPLSGVVRFI